MNLRIILLSLLLLTFAALIHGQDSPQKVDDNGPALSEKEQREFLSSRLPTSSFAGTFVSYGSLLYAVNSVAIHTKDVDIANTKLSSPFIADYQPTWKELFDSIAIQTTSTWAYDSKRNYWVFASPGAVHPYDLKVAEGWTSHDQGIYVGYKPPTFPVGMDIYQLGSYSATDSKSESALFKNVRDSLALRFASAFDRGIAVKDMRTETVDGVDALFYEASSPVRKEVMWRQWVLVKNGRAFAIVSTLKKDDTKLFSDVKEMVKSFHVR